MTHPPGAASLASDPVHEVALIVLIAMPGPGSESRSPGCRVELQVETAACHGNRGPGGRAVPRLGHSYGPMLVAACRIFPGLRLAQSSVLPCWHGRQRPPPTGPASPSKFRWHRGSESVTSESSGLATNGGSTAPTVPLSCTQALAPTPRAAPAQRVRVGPSRAGGPACRPCLRPARRSCTGTRPLPSRRHRRSMLSNGP